MSDDYKAAFRAAQAQRGLAAKPTKQQLKALKAKQGPAGSATAAPKQVQFQAAPAGKPISAAGVPADFFDSKGSVTPKQQQRQQSAAALKPPPQQPQPDQQQPRQQKQPGQQLAGMKRPAAAAAVAADAAGVKAAANSTDVAADTAVPKGFFDSKAADDSARGIKAPTKKDKEAAFADFAASMDDQLKQQAVQEDEEAVEAALEREEQEAFEQQMRLDRTAQLKALRNKSGIKDQLEIDAAIAAAVPAASKKRRVVDVLQDVLGGVSEGDTEEGDEDEGGLLDWRAKVV